jgi:hypothetical protein
LWLDADRQRPEKTRILADLLLRDSLAFAERNEDAIGNLKRPDFGSDGIINCKLFQNAAAQPLLSGWSRDPPTIRKEGK